LVRRTLTASKEPFVATDDIDDDLELDADNPPRPGDLIQGDWENGGTVEPGVYDGRVLRVLGTVVVAAFRFRGAYGVEETIEIDLETLHDRTHDAPLRSLTRIPKKRP
jgi:hypothetical protein